MHDNDPEDPDRLENEPRVPDPDLPRWWSPPVNQNGDTVALPGEPPEEDRAIWAIIRRRTEVARAEFAERFLSFVERLETWALVPDEAKAELLAFMPQFTAECVRVDRKHQREVLSKLQRYLPAWHCAPDPRDDKVAQVVLPQPDAVSDE